MQMGDLSGLEPGSGLWLQGTPGEASTVCLCARHMEASEVLVSVHPWEISETSPPQGRGQGNTWCTI